PADEEEAGPKRPPPKKKAKRSPSRKGLVEGQLYADNLADAARDRARSALKPDVRAVLDAIRKGESYADVRKRLLKAYADMDPKKLANVTAATMAMAQLAGRYALARE